MSNPSTPLPEQGGFNDMDKKNLIKLPDAYGKLVDVDMEDLGVELDYDPQMYHPMTIEARRNYSVDDIYQEYRGGAVETLLEITKNLNARIKALEEDAHDTE